MQRRTAFTCLVLVLLSLGAHAQGTDWLSKVIQDLKDEPTPQKVVADTTGMALRTYHLKNLQVGEAGKPQQIVGLLRNMLPAGSNVTPDPKTSTLHVLTTIQAHEAVLNFLSLVDQGATPAAAQSGALPPEVGDALRKLAEQSGRLEAMQKAIEAAQGRAAQEQKADLQEYTSRQQRYLVLTVLVLGAAMVLVLVLVIRRKKRPAGQTETPSLTLAPVEVEQLSRALVPVMAPEQERVRTALMQHLNEVAITLESNWKRQQEALSQQQRQLEAASRDLVLRQQEFTSKASSVLEDVTSKVEGVAKAQQEISTATQQLAATNEDLAKSNIEQARRADRLEQVVTELQRTQQELDEARTKHLEAEQRALQAELAKTREAAQLAALRMLLEDGGETPPETPPTPPVEPPSVTGSVTVTEVSDTGAMRAEPRAEPRAELPRIEEPNAVLAPAMEAAPTLVAVEAPTNGAHQPIVRTVNQPGKPPMKFRFYPADSSAQSH